ncbi:MAG: FRG domain-containing protein [Desulfovibrio sp.]
MEAHHISKIGEKTYSARTLQEVLDIVFFLKELLKTRLWFRGQGPYGELTPSMLRHAQFVGDQFYRKTTITTLSGKGKYAYPNQFNMIYKFQKISDHLFKLKPSNRYEWLCIMQHYGIPTKLLDWTTDPFTALFFATDISEAEMQRRIDEGSYGAELWILPPVMLNQSSLFNYKNIFSSTDNHVDAFLDGEGDTLPIAISAPAVEERLILQKGCFTLHGYDIRPLNFMCHNRAGFMYKIEIPADALSSLKDNLVDFGHTHAYYYPNDDTKYKKIKNDELKAFFRWYNGYKKELGED